MESQHIAGHASVVPRAAPDLLAARSLPIPGSSDRSPPDFVRAFIDFKSSWFCCSSSTSTRVRNKLAARASFSERLDCLFSMVTQVRNAGFIRRARNEVQVGKPPRAGCAWRKRTMDKPTEDQIRQRAHELWEQSHRPDGRDDKLWNHPPCQ